MGRVKLDQEQARLRLQNALKKIEERMTALEARPSLDDIKALKKEREADLERIQDLRSQIGEILNAEKMEK